MTKAASEQRIVPARGPRQRRGVVLPPEPAVGFDHVYHQFTVRVDGSMHRSIETPRLSASWPRAWEPACTTRAAVFDYDCYREHPNVVIDDVPNAEAIASQVFSLPIHQHLSDVDLATIVETVSTVFA